MASVYPTWLIAFAFEVLKWAGYELHALAIAMDVYLVYIVDIRQ